MTGDDSLRGLARDLQNAGLPRFAARAQRLATLLDEARSHTLPEVSAVEGSSPVGAAGPVPIFDEVAEEHTIELQALVASQGS